MDIKLLESIKFFIIYFIELSLLFIFISAIVSTINHKYKNILQKHLNKNSYTSYIKSIMIGALTPFCSCSTIPLLQALLKANVAFGVCIAYLFTSPLINPIIIVMLFLTFGLKITLTYVIILCITIFIISILMQTLNSKKLLKDDFKKDSISIKSKSFYITNKPNKLASFSITRPQTDKYCNSKTSKQSCCNEIKSVSIKNLFYQSLRDYKELIPYIVIGMSIGAFIHGFVPQEFIQNYLNGFGFLSVIFAAFVGIFAIY